MKVFTRPQQDLLKALMRVADVRCNFVAHTWALPLRTQISAIKATLVRKGLATEDELLEAVKEAEAARAVDEALNPELQEAYAEVDRLLTKLESHNQKTTKHPTKKIERRQGKADRRRRA